MKTPVYIANPTNVHCQQAVQAMVLLAFKHASFVGSRMFSQLDKMNEAESDKWTSDYSGIMGMAKDGMSVIYASSYDLVEYSKNPYEMYLDYCGKAVADTFQDKLDLKKSADSAYQLSNLKPHNYSNIRGLKTKSLLELLDAGYLVNAWVDSGQMRGTGKFSGHYVLVYGHDGESVMAHDPGGSISRGDPHNIGKRIQIDRFDTIRRYPETNNAGAFIAYKAA